MSNHTLNQPPGATAQVRHPCADDPELWQSTDPADQYKAVLGCHRCPIEEACRVLGDGEIHGVWGGLVRGRTGLARQPIRLVCQHTGCHQPFVSTTARAKFCSAKCRRRQETLNKSERQRQRRAEERARRAAEEELLRESA